MTGQQQILAARGNIGEGAPQNQTGGVNASFNQDGTCSSSATLPTPANWYTIAPQPGVGFLYWLKITDTGGSGGTAAALVGASVSAFTGLGGGGPIAHIPSGIGGRNFSYIISNSASGSPTVASGTGNISNSS